MSGPGHPPTSDGSTIGGGDADGPSGLHRALSALGVLLVVIAVAWRARFGISFFDDGYNASLPLRLALGARPFVDEMTPQLLGFLIPALFARAWHALFGLAGLVLALRLLYVAAATAVGAVVYRTLRPTVPFAGAHLAAAAPLLAPPYNILGLTYNTTVLLAYLLAWALALRAGQTGSRRIAAAAGVAAAIGAIAYPPVALGAVVLLATFVAMRETRRLTPAALLGAGAVLVVFGAWLLANARPADVLAAFAYSSSVLEGVLEPADRFWAIAENLRDTLLTPWLIPMWLLAVVASVRNRAGSGIRLATLLLPAAAFLPNIIALRLPPGVDFPHFGVQAGSYIIALTAGLALPVLAWHRRAEDERARRMLVLAFPVSITNMLAVAYFTSAGWHWAVPAIGLAPLAAALVAGWALACRDDADLNGTLVLPVVAAGVILGLLVLLYGSTFKDDPPLTLSHTLREPAVLGIVTHAEQAERIEVVAEIGRRQVAPNEGVLFVHGQLGYVLVDAPMVTNAVWLATGPTDAESVAYFERTGRWPDVVFVSLSLVESLGPSGVADDPLLGRLNTDYDSVEVGGGFVVYRLR
jgi:hypothetical protein